MPDRIRFSIVQFAMLTSLLAACGSPTPAPTPTGAPTAIPTKTSIPATTPLAETPLPTTTATTPPTATPTETPQPTATSTSVPTMTPSATATSLPKATATAKATPTPRPTAIPTTPAPTTAPVASSGAVPPPQVVPFNSHIFLEYLDYAHVKYQMFLEDFGSVVKGDHTGSCTWFFTNRNAIMAIVAFTGAPEQWTAMVDEYNASRTQVLTAIEPLHILCQGGGGAIPEGLDRQIIDLFERVQNRMYEILKQAKAMP